MSRRAATAIALVALAACTTGPQPKPSSQQPSAAPSPATSPATSTTVRSTTPSAAASSPGDSASSSSPAAVAPPLPTTFGSGPSWPRAPRGAAPAAYGGALTKRVAAVAGGGTLAASLLLPRLDSNARSPLVMTPCGRRVRLRGGDVDLVPAGSGGPLPKPANRLLVLIDPGHGGGQDGAIGVDGSREADRVLALAKQVARLLAARVGRVYLTRTRDIQESLAFRVALGDALRADVAVSVHLNAEPDGVLDRPGVETYGSVADPQGRRLAGVMYEAERRFLQTLPGPWVGDTDAGAKYRIGRAGGDYYGLLRRAHVPWVISESLFMTSAHDLRLLDQPAFARGLATAIADGATDFATSRAAGSGWVRPYPRLPNPAPAPGSDPPCVDPAR